MQSVKAPHHRKVGFRHRARQLIDATNLLIRGAQRARCQAETPLIVLFRFSRPALCVVVPIKCVMIPSFARSALQGANANCRPDRTRACRTAAASKSRPMPEWNASEASYCVPMRRDAPIAVPKRGQCPSGFASEAHYCVEKRRAKTASIERAATDIGPGRRPLSAVRGGT
jgi:hypothetical protein